jgi:hypothetical protein
MIYELLLAGWACAGAVTLLGFKVQLAAFPEAAKPALAAVHLCRPDLRVEKYDPARRQVAFDRALATGGRLRRCRGVVCKDVPILTTTTVKIDDRPEEGP